MEKLHTYSLAMIWTGNQGEGTKNYRAFSRDHIIKAEGKPELPGSSDPNFRGSRDRYNPEELLVASLSSCHMLWYLHLCSDQHIVVTAYRDQPIGRMIETADGNGHFKEVELHPEITITDETQLDKALHLHEQAHRMCFIANSVNFPVTHHPVFKIAPVA